MHSSSKSAPDQTHQEQQQVGVIDTYYVLWPAAPTLRNPSLGQHDVARNDGVAQHHVPSMKLYEICAVYRVDKDSGPIKDHKPKLLCPKYPTWQY